MLTVMSEVIPTIYSAYTMLVDVDKVLLLRRANTGFADGQFSFPAGRVDPQETPTDAALREVLEEVGVSIEKNDLIHVHTTHRIPNDIASPYRVDNFFLARKWHGEPINKEPQKCSELGWFAMEHLPNDTTELTKFVVASVLSGSHYSELYE
jgi:ADP-ribose pyrophosphatase YjhB (NUDIX family)